MEINVVDNPDQERYEARTIDGDELAGLVQYRQRPDGLALTHTEVLDAFGGQGVGGSLARAALDDIRAKDMKVIPLCPFIAGFIRRNPDYRDLVVDRYQAEVG